MIQQNPMEKSSEKTNIDHDEHEEQFSYAMQLVTSTSMTMVLVNVIKLQVLETIAEAGPNTQLSAHEIATRLSILNKDAPDMLDRMLRLLASYSVVTCSVRSHDSKAVRVYGLAPVAKYFVRNEDGVSLGGYMELAQDKVYIDTWFKLKDTIVEGGIPFNKVNGTHTFQYQATDARYNKLFNNAMISHTTIVIKEILKHYQGFNDLKQVVDVGGGLGVTLNMIISQYPTIKGINFDLPHVIRDAPAYPGVEYVAGDMFENVPQGDAIFLKWILHDWSDDHCLRLLKNCYTALPDDGKVIVVETVLSFLPDKNSADKVTTQFDVIMMTHVCGGKERTDDEFMALAKRAGFRGIRKECLVCNFWVMEFYK